jgi:hypothetical protein
MLRRNAVCAHSRIVKPRHLQLFHDPRARSAYRLRRSYFLDESGLFCNEAKLRCDQAVPEEQVCVVKGTIAWEELVDAPTADSIRECMERLVDEHDVVAAFSTDRTILEAYDNYDANIDARTDTVRWQTTPGQPISAEAYGIGLPNDSTALCNEVAAALQEFVDTRWDRAFANNLAASQAPDGHKPPTDDVHCFDPLTPPSRGKSEGR